METRLAPAKMGISVKNKTTGVRIAQLPLINRIVTQWRARKFHTSIICHHCLRRTRLMKSRYAPERRYCEHCARELEHLDDPGRIIVTFGKVSLTPHGKMAVLADGDFEEFDCAGMALDVTDLYIDAATYSPLLLEKCLLHLNNYPPVHGVKAIRVFHTGSLEDLNPNIKALLKHHFTHIEPVNESKSEVTPQQANDDKPTFTCCTEHSNRAYFPPQVRCPWCEWACLPQRTPTLVSRLVALKDKNDVARKAAVDTLGKLGDARAVDALISALKDEEQWVRRTAATALGTIGDARAVESLLITLKDQDSDIRKAVARSLGQIGDARAVESLLITLKDQDWDIREAAARSLGQIGDTRAIEPLNATLKDQDSDVRMAAAVSLDSLQWVAANDHEQAVYLLAKRKWEAYNKLGSPAVELLNVVMGGLIGTLKGNFRADWLKREQAADALGRIGDTRAIEPLIAALDRYADGDAYVQSAATKALSKIGLPAVAPLIVALKNSDEHVQNAVVDALAKIGLPAVEALMSVALRDLYSRDFYYRGRAAKALVKIGQPVVDRLIVALNAGHGQDVAAWVLGEIGDICAIEPLIAILKDQDRDARKAAAEALGKIGGTRAVEPLIAILKDQDRSVRKAAAEALGKIGDARAVEPLSVTLKDQDWDVRKAAMKALGQIGQVAVNALIAALKDQDSDVREAAATLLDQLQWVASQEQDQIAYYIVKCNWEACVKIGQAAVEPLIAALKDRLWFRREKVAEALGEIGDTRAVEPLIAILKDQDSHVRKAAAKALGQIGDTRAVEPLIAALKDQEYTVQWNAVTALGEIGDARVVEPLIAALKNLDSHGQYWAAKALGKIGDARAVEPLSAILKKLDSRGPMTGLSSTLEDIHKAAEEAIKKIQQAQEQKK